MEGRYDTITSIQCFLDGTLRGRLDDNVFFDAPPQAIKDSWKSFVVADLGTEIRDMNAFSDGTVRIMVYVRPLAPGSVNAALMKEKERAMTDIISSVQDSHYVMKKLGVMSDYDIDTGFHVVTYILKIKIY